MTQTVAMVFPGQGSQKVGMAHGLGEDPQGRWDTAENVLGYSLRTLCLEGPTDTLMQTNYAQPAIFVVSAIVWDMLQQRGIHPTYVAGHSLGEITAYFAAGVLSFEGALRLIQVRGEAMAAATAPGTTGMAAVVGLGSDDVADALASVSGHGVVIANLNAPNQTVISGPLSGIEQLTPVVKDRGGKPIRLPVSGAFHSPLMMPAHAVLAALMPTLHLHDPATPVVLNRTGQPENCLDMLRDNVPLQVVSEVRWVDTVRFLATAVDHVIEVGPGMVLSGLCKKTVPDMRVSSVDGEEAVMAWCHALQKGVML